MKLAALKRTLMNFSTIRKGDEMTGSRFIWDTAQLKKVKVKEIREYKISKDKEGFYSVEVFGFFGGGIEIFKNKDLKLCREYIDTISEGRGREVKDE